MTSIGLPKTEPVYNQGQDTITSNWRIYQQIKRDKVL